MIAELEQAYVAKFGHTYTSLKARLVPDYVAMISYAVNNSVMLTDSSFGLEFPPGAAI